MIEKKIIELEKQIGPRKLIYTVLLNGHKSNNCVEQNIRISILSYFWNLIFISFNFLFIYF